MSVSSGVVIINTYSTYTEGLLCVSVSLNKFSYLPSLLWIPNIEYLHRISLEWCILGYCNWASGSEPT